MANPQIAYADLSTYTFTSGDTDTSYPLTNLNDYSLRTYWQSNTSGGLRYLNVQFASTQSIDAVVVGGLHNLKSSVGATIPVWSRNAIGQDVLFGNLTITADSASAYIVTSSAVSTNYMFLALSGSSAKVKVSNVFFSDALEFTTPQNYGYSSGDAEYTINEAINLQGTLRTTQLYGGRMIYDLEFTNQSVALRSAFQAFHRTVKGTLRPFWFIDTDSTTVYMHCENYIPIVHDNPNMFSLQLSMKSHEADF